MQKDDGFLSVFRRRKILFYLAGIFIFSFLLAEIATRGITFGSVEGGWVYNYIRDAPSLQSIILAAIVISNIVFLLSFSKGHIDKYEAWIIAIWFVVGSLSQLLIFFVWPDVSANWDYLGHVIKSDVCTSFYSVVLNYAPIELMRTINVIHPQLPLHTQANMPGKIIFFYMLKAVSNSPQVMAYLILLCSNLGAVLCYVICRKLFKSRAVGLYALILYLFIPAKIFFLIKSHAVTPLFILSMFLVWIWYLETKKTKHLFNIGFLLYITLFFEPLPLTMGMVFVALLMQAYLKKEVDNKELIKICLIPPLMFLLCHVLMILIFQYNIFDTIAYALKDIGKFNETKVYSIWVVEKVKEFFINEGIIPSFIFLTYLAALLLDQIKNGFSNYKELLLDNGKLLALALIVTFLFLDLTGIERQESTKTFIFCMAFFQLEVAYIISKIDDNLIYLAVSSAILQAVITLNMIGFHSGC